MAKRSLFFAALAIVSGAGYLFIQVADRKTPSTSLTLANVSQPVIDLEKFEAIKTGMTLQQVRAIVGSRGTMQSQVDVGGQVAECYIWQNPGGSNAIVTFSNGIVSVKAQAMLR